jgi:site-specific recombinase XerD
MNTLSYHLYTAVDTMKALYEPAPPAYGKTPPANPPSPKLLEQVRQAIRLKHYSIRTEQTYVDWIKRFILFHKTPQGLIRHPKAMGLPEIEAFLTHLAVGQNVADSTQNQALCAILFLYRDVLKQNTPWPTDTIRAKKPKRLPTVLTKTQTMQIITCLSGVHQLMAKILYGSGLRLMECMRLRVKDIDFEQNVIIVRDGKGENDRVTMLPAAAVPFLQEYLNYVSLLHQADLADRYGQV